MSFVNIEYGNDSSEDEFDFSLSNDEIISICKEIGDRENESMNYENRDEVRGYVTQQLRRIIRFALNEIRKKNILSYIYLS